MFFYRFSFVVVVKFALESRRLIAAFSFLVHTILNTVVAKTFFFRAYFQISKYTLIRFNFAF